MLQHLLILSTITQVKEVVTGLPSDVAGQACLLVAVSAAHHDGLSREAFLEACECSFDQLKLVAAEAAEDRTETDN